MFKSIITAGCAALCLSGLGNAVAHEEHEGHGHSKTIEYRHSIMTIYKWNVSAMAAMVKGDVPYDKDAFARHAADLSAAAHLDLLAGFPEGSDEGEDSSARTDIWMDWAGFKAKYEALTNASAELAEVAKSGELDAIKPRFGAVGKSCKSCHDAFKD